MKLNFECPACNHKMGVIRFFSAMIPTIFTCTKCRSTIRIKGVTKYFILTFGLVGFVVMFGLSKFYEKHQTITLGAFLVALAGMLALEFVNALIICNKAKIIVKKDRHNKEN